MDFILFGIQGSGKGTQGKILAPKHNLPYFETGAELRKLSQEDSELGRKVKTTIEAGNLVTNETVMEIVVHFLDAHKDAKSIIFDGIPRSLPQAESLVQLFQKYGRDFIGVVIELSRHEAEQRLLNRRMCKVCKRVYPMTHTEPKCECGGELVIRSDDNAESINRRLDVYEQETVPIVEDWKSKNKMITVNGTPPIEEVTKDFTEKLNPLITIT